MLSKIYSDPDVFVNPSLADSGPIIAAKSLLCGTPVVRFKEVGNAQEIINDRNYIYFANYSNAEDLVQGIIARFLTIDNHSLTLKSSFLARYYAKKHHDSDACSERHLSLYQKIMKSLASNEQ